MKFYVSWYQADPLYQLYDDDCHMLISPTSVSNSWTLSRFPRLPRSVMIDSGGFRYMLGLEQMPTPQAVFERQLRILDGLDVPATLCALDFPLAGPGLSSNELDRRITLTIAYAYDFKRLVEMYGLDGEITCIAVIQGYDTASLIYCAQELKSIGFTAYGVGSLAGLQKHDEVLARVAAAMSVVGKQVHVFGLSSIHTIRALKKMGVASVDSSRPVKAAAYNEVLYSHPFRRYGILGTDGNPTGIISRKRCLSEPLPCNCPVCQENSRDILGVGNHKYIGLRAVHNYFHMKWAIQAP